MTKNTFGNNIALFRGKAGITQAELAKRLGVSAQAISKWETGGGYPDAETIPLLARQLVTTTDSLFGIEEKKPENRVFDSERWKADIIDALKDEIAILLSQLRNMLEDELQCAVQDAVEEALSDYDGGGRNTGKAEQIIMILSPDKSKLFRCVGGIRISDPSDVYFCPPDRFALIVQTARDRWDSLCYFSDQEQAQAALYRIGEAMRIGEREISL